MPDADQRPSGTAQATDQIVERDAFDRAFETLDAQERSLIVLHHLEDRPLAEIAAVLRIPVGTAKSRLFSARRRLETALSREDGSVAGRHDQDGTAR